MQKTKSKIYGFHAFEDLNRQRLAGEHCDVTLIVNGDRISGHRCVLSASSLYFRAMFSTEMKEKHQKDIELHDLKASAVKQLIDFMYTGEIELTQETVCDVLHVASFTQTTNFKDSVFELVEKMLSPQTCIAIRKIAMEYSSPHVLSLADQCIFDYFHEASLQDDFFQLENSHLADLLASDKLKVKTEHIVYQALLKWVKYDIDHRRAAFLELFKYIRLHNVSYGYLVDDIRKEPLVCESPECRDMVNDAMDFYQRPQKYFKQNMRAGQLAQQESLLLFESEKPVMSYDLTTQCWNSEEEVKTNVAYGSWRSAQRFYQQLPVGCSVVSTINAVLFCGGYTGHSNPSQMTVTFDGDKWKTAAHMIECRFGASAVAVQGRYYVFGGVKRAPPKNPEAVIHQHNEFVEYVEMLDDLDADWKNVARLVTPRYSAAAVAIADSVYLMGGICRLSLQNRHAVFKLMWLASDPLLPTSTVEIFNTTTRTWKTAKDMNSSRSSFGAVALNNKIYVCGGSTRDFSSDVEFMDCDSGVWINVKSIFFRFVHPIFPSRSKISACVVDDKIAIVCRGSTSTLLIYDPVRDTWTKEKFPYEVEDPKIATKSAITKNDRGTES